MGHMLIQLRQGRQFNAVRHSAAACCSKCSGSAFCSPQSGNCYKTKGKTYYVDCPTDTGSACCFGCSGSAFCSPKSGNCYSRKAREYYKTCTASPGTLVPKLPPAKSSAASIKFMSYNLMGWSSFNAARWRGKNVIRKIADWGPAILGAQEVEKGGYGY